MDLLQHQEHCEKMIPKSLDFLKDSTKNLTHSTMKKSLHDTSSLNDQTTTTSNSSMQTFGNDIRDFLCVPSASLIMNSLPKEFHVMKTMDDDLTYNSYRSIGTHRLSLPSSSSSSSNRLKIMDRRSVHDNFIWTTVVSDSISYRNIWTDKNLMKTSSSLIYETNEPRSNSTFHKFLEYTSSSSMTPTPLDVSQFS